MIERYQGAAYRYLLGALRDADAAEEVFQEFALRVVEGRFRTADQNKGRFRDYLRTTLIHMVSEHRHKKARGVVFLAGLGLLATDRPDPCEDERFLESWRDEVIHTVWQLLQESEQASGKPLYTVLKARVDHPDLNSEELVELLKDKLQTRTELTPANVRNHPTCAREVRRPFDRRGVPFDRHPVDGSDRRGANRVKSTLVLPEPTKKPWLT